MIDIMIIDMTKLLVFSAFTLVLPIDGLGFDGLRVDLHQARRAAGKPRNMRLRVLANGDLQASALPAPLLVSYAYDLPFASSRLSGHPGLGETYRHRGQGARQRRSGQRAGTRKATADTGHDSPPARRSLEPA